MASKTETRRINIYINGKEIENSGKAIKAAFYKARAEWEKTNKAADDYEQKLANLNQAKKHLDKHKAELKGVSKSWLNFKTIVGGFLSANAIQGALRKLGAFLKDTLMANAKLSDSFADVMKTTGLTRDEVGALHDDFKAFNTRTPRNELLKLAAVAGKLGVKGSANVKEFVRQANQINVALGEDLGADAVLQIGKIADAFETDMLKIGSAINEVGSSSLAQEQYLVDFTTRMQGTGLTAGIAAADIIGYGAALDGTGLKVEMSGTALNKFFIDFVKNTEKYGEAAGFASGALSELVGQEGTNSGFLAFIERLKAANPEGKDFLKQLEKLGINGDRGAQVFLGLSENLDKVRANQEVANKAFVEGTSLTKEYSIKNENLAANLEKVQNWLSEMFVNSSIMKGAESIVGLFADWVAIPLSEQLNEERTELRLLEARIISGNIPQAERVGLITELKKQYPQHLSNIDAETISNDELSVALKKVNDELINKIVIQGKQEEINEANKESADILADLVKAEDKAMEGLVKMQDQYGKFGAELKSGGTVAENLLNYYDQILDIRKKNNFTDAGFGGVSSDKSELESFRALIGSIQTDQNKLNEANEAGNILLDEKTRLMERLGFNSPGGDDGDDGNGSGNGSGNGDGDDGDGVELTAKQKAELKELERLQKEYAANSLELQRAFEDAQILLMEEGEARDIAALEKKYERDVKEIKDTHANAKVKNNLLEAEEKVFNQNKQKIIDGYQADKDRLAEEHAQKEIENRDKVYMATLEGEDAEVVAAMQKYDELIALAEQYGIDVAEIERLRDEEVAEIHAEGDEERKIKSEAALQADRDLWLRKVDHITDYANKGVDILNAINSIQNVKAEESLGKISASKDKELEKLEKLREGDSLSQEEYEKRKATIDDKYRKQEAEIKTKQFNRQKIADVTQATINTALAVTRALASGGPLMAGLVGIAGGLEIAAIAATPVPTYGKGGLFDGPSHSSVYGGMPILDPSTGEVKGMMEGGEPILSRNTRKNNRPIVDALLDSSMNKNGAAINIPYLNSENQNVVNFDSFSGNSSSTSTSETVAFEGSSTTHEGFSAELLLMRDMMGEIQKLKQNPAPISITQLKEKQREIDTAKRLGGYNG